MTVKSLMRYFLFLGVTGFGGPLVLIQQMRGFFVDEKKQIAADEFDQAFALVKAMPGPVAFQMAVFIGNRFCGFLGALVSGIALIFPAFWMMVAAGYFYEDFSRHPLVSPFLDGLLFAASAVILMSVKSLVWHSRKSFVFWGFVAAGYVIFFFKALPEPVTILLFGALYVATKKFAHKTPLMSVAFLFVDWEKVITLTKVCLSAGAVVFGTGLALMPVLKSDLVDTNQLLTLKQFNDGVVFGQMTPGPVTITATFLGYQVSGLIGAAFTTLGVFFFPFLHMATWFPHAMSWFQRQKWIQPFVLGATAAVAAGIFHTLVQMNVTSVKSLAFWFIFAGALAVQIWARRVPTLALFLLAGAANLFVHVIFYQGT